MSEAGLMLSWLLGWSWVLGLATGVWAWNGVDAQADSSLTDSMCSDFIRADPIRIGSIPIDWVRPEPMLFESIQLDVVWLNWIRQDLN